MGAARSSDATALTRGERLAGLSPAATYRALRIAAALGQQRLDDAQRDLLLFDARARQHAEFLRLLGTLRLLRGFAADAYAALSAAFAQRPNDPLILDALGGALERLGDYAQALTVSQRACELGPELASCWFNRARILHAVGRAEAAVAACRRVLTLVPQHVNARTMLADALNAEGHGTAAQTLYRDIVRHHPDTCGMAWWGLASVRPLPLAAADIPALRRSAHATSGSDHHRIASAFALAHALERQGDYTQAFAQLQWAHERARHSQCWSAADFSEQADALLALDDGAVPEFDSTTRGADALFIVSLPRSGSTLVEQILASHLQVEGAGELPFVRQVLGDESARRGCAMSQWMADATRAQWAALGRRYLALTAPWRQRSVRFTDKMPGNWLFIGAIRAMLPGARIVVVRRDRLETATACYRQFFTGQAYTHTFADLAAYCRDFDRAVQRWRIRHPRDIHEIVAEDLAADPAPHIRRLLEFCDLPFDPACLAPHATRRRIATPSVNQVREPIGNVTPRAPAYGALLDPLRLALGLEAFRAPH